MMKKLFLIYLLFAFVVKTNLFAVNVTVGPSGANYIVDGLNDENEIQLAINFVSNNGGGVVTLQNFNYQIGLTRINAKNNVTLRGASQAGTILFSNRTHDYVVGNFGTPVKNFSLENLTINPNNALNASGVRFEYATNCAFRDIKFINVTCGGWHMVVGIEGNAAQNANDFSRQIDIKNCIFDGHAGSLEMLLLYNSKRVLIENCTFKNKIQGSGCIAGGLPVIGLWQKTDSIFFKGCTFLNNVSNECIYYSNTSNNTLIENCNFTNTGNGIKGANESDWGTFGVPYAKNMIVRNCTFQGGANDVTKAAITVGATVGTLIKNCTIQNYELGVSFSTGYDIVVGNGTPLNYNAKHWLILNSAIKDNNVLNNVHNLHPGILIQKNIGAINGFTICGEISDYKNPPNQYRPISVYLDNPGTVDSLKTLGTTLVGYPGGELIYPTSGVTLGTNVVIGVCSGASPPSYCSFCPNISDANAISLINNYDPITATIISNLLNFQSPVTALPLQLIDFKGFVKSDKNYLVWKTAEANNVSHFEIERSDDGINFEKIGRLQFERKNDYTFEDYYPLKKAYYRLKITDFDGRFEYSKIIALTDLTKNKVSIFPNPTNGKITILNPNNAIENVVGYNCFGQLVFNQVLDNQSITIDLSFLPKGIYFIKVGADSFKVILEG